MRRKILVADDDATTRSLVGLWLRKGGYVGIPCPRAEEVLAAALQSNPDLILLDVVFGPADGIEICRQLKKHRTLKSLPVVLMSGARLQDDDMVDGLQGGADDYLLKPLHRDLLLAKIEAVLRRALLPRELPQIYRRYGLHVNVTEHRVKVEDREVELTRKEFDLLNALLKSQGGVLSAQDLLESVWGYEKGVYDDPHTVEVHLSRLKKKLGTSFSSHITTLVGSGYRLD